MPLRLKRLYENTDLHFVTFSCYHREPNLRPTLRKDLFLTVLERVRQQYRFGVIGCVVMPEHVHLLLSKPESTNLSVVLQVLKQIVSRKVSAIEPSALAVSFWQRRFCDFNVRTEHKRIEKLKYLHQNPVTRGLVEKPEDWEWSSFRYYAFGEPFPVTIDSSWLVGRQPSVDPTLRKNAKDPYFLYAALSMSPCAAFFKESRMKFADPTSPIGNPGSGAPGLFQHDRESQPRQSQQH
jgi:putative transposase